MKLRKRVPSFPVKPSKFRRIDQNRLAADSDQTLSPRNSGRSTRVSVVTPEKFDNANFVKNILCSESRHSGALFPAASRKLFAEKDKEMGRNKNILSVHAFLANLKEATVCFSNDANNFLETVVGTEERYVKHFTDWAGWNQSSLPSELQLDKSTTLSNQSVLVRVLMQSLVRKDLTRMKLLLVSEAVNGVVLSAPIGSHGRSVLHAICMHARIDFCMHFLRNAKKLHSRADNFGMSPLHYAILNPWVEKMDSIRILAKTCHSSTTKTVCSPIHLFCVAHCVLEQPVQKPLQEHLAECVQVMYTREPAFAEGLYPHMMCCYGESSSGIKSGVNRGEILLCVVSMDPSVVLCKTADGMSSLHLACKYGHPQLIRFLVPDSFPERAMVCDQGYSPMHLAAMAGDTAIHAQCINELMNIVPSSALVACISDFSGWTPLLYACSAKFSSTLSACIESDLQLVDPTWGRFPQFVHTLHTMKGLMKGRAKEVWEMLKFFMSLPRSQEMINQYISIGNNATHLLSDPLKYLVDCGMAVSSLSVDNKVKYLSQRAKAFTREQELPVSAKIMLAPNEWNTVTNDSSQFCLWLCSTLAPVLDTVKEGQSLVVFEPLKGVDISREFFQFVNCIYLCSVDSVQEKPESLACTFGKVVALSIVSCENDDRTREPQSVSDSDTLKVHASIDSGFMKGVYCILRKSWIMSVFTEPDFLQYLSEWISGFG